MTTPELSTDEARRTLARARSLARAALAPAAPAEIGRSIELLAHMFRCDTPEPDAMKLYVMALQTVGNEAMKQGIRQILTTHRYPNLPLPAEIIEAGGEKERILKVLLRRIDMALAKLG